MKKDESTTLTMEYVKYDIKDPASTPADNTHLTDANPTFLNKEPALVTDQVETFGVTLLILDAVKLALYSIYFGKQQINDFKFFFTHYHKAEFSNFFSVIWNALVSFLNITNFVIFLILSRNYSTNDLLQKNEFVNSFELQNYYWQA